jgi:2-dehydropantoate 2-reductase
MPRTFGAKNIASPLRPARHEVRSQEQVMRFMILGAGGIGCYYGARLAAAGHEVDFIARGAQLAALTARGLTVRHRDWVFCRPVRAFALADYLARVTAQQLDAVFVCVKGTATREVARALGSWSAGRPGAYFISLQNGVDNEAVLAAEVGERRVIGGLAVRIGSHQVAPAEAEAVGPGQVELGIWPMARPSDPRGGFLERLVPTLQGAGIPARTVPDIRRELWRKLLINNGVNPLSALTGLDTGALTRHPDFTRVVYGLMVEAGRAAAAAGVALERADWDEMYRLICEFDPIKTSMLVDREHGRGLEVDTICGAVLERSARLGLEAPYTFTVASLLRYTEAVKGIADPAAPGGP